MKFRFRFFLLGMDDNCSGKSFSIPISKVKYINNHFGSYRMILFIYSIYSHAFSSFLMICFMNGTTTMIVNHKQCLYSHAFSSFQNSIPFFFYYLQAVENILFCTIYEGQTAWKISFNFLWRRFQSFVILYISAGLVNIFLSYSILNLLYISTDVALLI